MPDWADTPGEILTVLSITTMVFAGLMWLIKAQIAQMKELKPNGGSSMRDAINRIEERQINIQDKLHRHLEWHLEDEHE